MNIDIDTFNFLLDSITAEVCLMIVKEMHIPFEEALLVFHNSDTFSKLQDYETGLYIESASFIFDIYKHEHTFGTIRMEVQ